MDTLHSASYSMQKKSDALTHDPKPQNPIYLKVKLVFFIAFTLTAFGALSLIVIDLIPDFLFLLFFRVLEHSVR